MSARSRYFRSDRQRHSPNLPDSRQTYPAAALQVAGQSSREQRVSRPGIQHRLHGAARCFIFWVTHCADCFTSPSEMKHDETQSVSKRRFKTHPGLAWLVRRAGHNIADSGAPSKLYVFLYDPTPCFFNPQLPRPAHCASACPNPAWSRRRACTTWCPCGWRTPLGSMRCT